MKPASRKRIGELVIQQFVDGLKHVHSTSEKTWFDLTSLDKRKFRVTITERIPKGPR